LIDYCKCRRACICICRSADTDIHKIIDEGAKESNVPLERHKEKEKNQERYWSPGSD
jgi:hypothetical protein